MHVYLDFVRIRTVGKQSYCQRIHLNVRPRQLFRAILSNLPVVSTVLRQHRSYLRNLTATFDVSFAQAGAKETQDVLAWQCRSAAA